MRQSFCGAVCGYCQPVQRIGDVTVDAWVLISHLFDYTLSDLTAETRAVLRAITVTHVMEIIDGYLLVGGIVLIGLALFLA